MVEIETKLYRFQRVIVHRRKNKPITALYMEQRTGKTLIVLKLISIWKPKLVLIVCPKSVMSVWPRQMRRHMTGKYRILEGPQKLEKAREFVRHPPRRLTFLIINYDSVRSWEKLLRRLPIDVMVADEGHHIRNRGSKRSRVVYRVGRGVSRKLELTGTPVPKGLINLWAQFRYLKPDLLGDTWGPFERKYTRKAGYGFYARRIKKHMEPVIMKKLAPYCVWVKKRDVMPWLPPEADQDLIVHLEGRHRKFYDDLYWDFIAHLEEDITVVTEFTMTQMIRLQEVANGYIKKEDESFYHFKPNPKLQALIDFIEPQNEGKKIVIAARFIEDLRIIQEAVRKLDRSCELLYGKSPDKKIWHKFQDKRDPEVLACQIGAGEGIELHAADTALYFSVDFDFVHWDQFRQRLMAPDQKNAVSHILVSAENTIDNYLQNALQKKGNVANNIIKEMRRHARTESSQIRSQVRSRRARHQ